MNKIKSLLITIAIGLIVVVFVVEDSNWAMALGAIATAILILIAIVDHDFRELF